MRQRDAEEQLADSDTSEAAAIKLAQATLAALIATRDAEGAIVALTIAIDSVRETPGEFSSR